MDSVNHIILITLTLCILDLRNVNPSLDSGQLIKTDSCTCPEGVITYMCIIDGTDPGGFTIWNGTAFNCGQSDNILLRHNLFGTQTGAFGSCNGGTISGRSLRVSSDNVYTSQLQVNVTNSSRSELVGGTVQCVYSPDGSTYIVIDSTTITITDPLLAPDDIQLTQVKRDELTFSWSSVEPNCSTLQYELQSNCGTCTNNPDMPPSAVCSFELSAISNGVCNFAVQSTICGNIVGLLSSSILVTLRVPASPMIQSVIPTYNMEGELISIEMNFTDVDLFNISNTVDGSVLYYNVNFIDTSGGVICNSSNVSASSCSRRICMVPPVQLTRCSQTGSINIRVSAVNLLGEGPDSSTSITSTNQYVEVMFESTNKIVCTFRDQQDDQMKSCYLAYGPCRQNRNFNMTILGTLSLNSPNVVMINFPSQLSSSGYCYIINANNGTFTTQIEGIFDANSGRRNTNAALAIGITVTLLIIVIIAIVSVSIILILKPWKRRRRRKTITSARDEQEGQILLRDQTDAAQPEYEDVPAHIIFNIYDRLEELIEALRLLSNLINIKNIKISPFNTESDDDIELEKKVCIECDPDLTKEQKTQLEELPKLGLPDTRKVNLGAEQEQVIKNKENSNSLRTITVILQHKKGALCGLLQTVQSTDECQHISITDIIHQPVSGRDDRKRVTVKILPQLPKKWRASFEENKSKCEYILPEEGESMLSEQ